MNPVGALRSLWWCVREAPAATAVAALLAVLGTAAALVPFYAVYLAVRLLVAGGDPAGLLGYAALAAAGVAVRYVCTGLAAWVSHVGAYRALARIRLRLADHLGTLPAGAVSAHRSGALKKVLVDDVEKLEAFLAHAVPDLVSALTVWVATMAWLVVVDWRLALATAVVVPIAFLLMGRATRGAGVFAVEYGTVTGRMNAAIAELVAGLPTLKGFGRLDRDVGEVERTIAEQGRVSVAMSRRMIPWATAFYVLVSASAVTILPTAAWLFAVGAVDGVTVLFFAVLGLGANAAILQLYLLVSELALLTVAGGGVRALLAEPAQPDTGADPVLPHHDVELTGVTFGYDERPVLHDVSLRAATGAVTALVGASGSGKSTVGRLVARLYDTAEGTVRVGGTDVRELGRDALRRTVSLVVQDTFLFTGTIADNLRMARPEASDEEVRAVARAARVDEFVAALPAGYDTVVGERGATLSGGQAQRIAIARAILADTPVVVLDEATAFADPENEAAVQDALSILLRGRTLLVIAHRLGSVVGADRIVVLDGGRVVETGTHVELVAAGGTYAGLWADWVGLDEGMVAR